MRRYGEAIFPVDVLVTFKDGKQIREHWDGRGRWNRYTYTGESQARFGDRSIPSACCSSTWTTRTTRNRWRLDGRSAATKWSLKWMIWLQDALLSWAFLA